MHYGRISGSSLIRDGGEAATRSCCLVMGLLIPGIDNFAHAGGFLGGYATSAFFNPLTRERGDHMLDRRPLSRGHLPRDRGLGTTRSTRALSHVTKN